MKSQSINLNICSPSYDVELNLIINNAFSEIVEHEARIFNLVSR